MQIYTRTLVLITLFCAITVPCIQSADNDPRNLAHNVQNDIARDILAHRRQGNPIFLNQHNHFHGQKPAETVGEAAWNTAENGLNGFGIGMGRGLGEAAGVRLWEGLERGAKSAYSLISSAHWTSKSSEENEVIRLVEDNKKIRVQLTLTKSLYEQEIDTHKESLAAYKKQHEAEVALLQTSLELAKQAPKEEGEEAAKKQTKNIENLEKDKRERTSQYTQDTRTREDKINKLKKQRAESEVALTDRLAQNLAQMRKLSNIITEKNEKSYMQWAQAHPYQATALAGGVLATATAIKVFVIPAINKKLHPERDMNAVD